MPSPAIDRTAPPWLKDLAGAWIFYSVLPAWPRPAPRFERIARFAPWIGLLIGGAQALLWWGLESLGWSAAALAPLVLACGVQLSGGLHHDGLMDTADGLGAGRDRLLEAMRDSRIGASGVLALAVVLLIEIAALIRLGGQAPMALLVAAIWGRSAPLWAMAHFDYLRKDGSAAFHRQHSRFGRDLVPLLLLQIPLLLLSGPLPVVVGLSGAILVPELLGRRLGGHTGDSYGAALVMTEALILFGLACLVPAI